MKTSVSRESPSRIRLTIEATAEEVAPSIARAVGTLGSEVKVPGFRAGKVPRKILESRVGADALREATLREAIPGLVGKAVEEETLSPITPPSVEVSAYELDGDLTLDAIIEVRPEITLPPLDGFKVNRPSTEPTEEEIGRELARLQDRFASLETVSRPARRGDFVLIDLTVGVHAEKIEDLSGTDQLYEVGSGGLVVELDQELDGRRAGEILKFNATLPAFVGEPHAGREVTFQVLVKEVRRKVTPDLNDEFAKTASEFDTLDALRADIAERIRKVKGVQADVEVRNVILEQIVEEVEVDPPESLVHEEMAYRVARLEDQLRANGLTLDQYMQRTGATEDQIEADLRRQADRNVRAQLVLEEIGRTEGFTVTEEELAEEVSYHAEAMRSDAEQLREQLRERGRLLALAGDIIRRKALNLLVEKADITEETPSGQAGEGEKK